MHLKITEETKFKEGDIVMIIYGSQKGMISYVEKVSKHGIEVSTANGGFVAECDLIKIGKYISIEIKDTWLDTRGHVVCEKCNKFKKKLELIKHESSTKK